MIKSKNLLSITLLIGSYGIFSCNNSGQISANNKDSLNNHMNHDKNMNLNNDMMKAMNSTMSGINAMNASGDFDCDFANMMILHHQSAINMSKLVIEKGTNEEIKSLAKNIKTNQEAEIAKMHTIIKNFKTIAADEKPVKIHKELAESMNNMMSKTKKIKMTGNTDKDFAMLMIPHHESAVKMAKDELSYGKQPALKKVAQQMIVDQENEINQFKDWLFKQK